MDEVDELEKQLMIAIRRLETYEQTEENINQICYWSTYLRLVRLLRKE